MDMDYGEVKSVYLGKFKRPPQCYCIPADREPMDSLVSEAGDALLR